MNLKRNSLTLTILLTLGLALTGCGSSIKKEADGKSGSVSGKDSKAESFEINSDSDSNSAGSLQTVFFDFNSSTLTSSARAALQNNADFMKKHTRARVQIEGHADERGGVQYNLALGERRAKSVRDYLIAMGVEGSRMTTVSFGKERPLAFGHDEAAWSQNRRGNFVITAK
jgi:peptidoglycan-associated lipoprotein